MMETIVLNKEAGEFKTIKKEWQDKAAKTTIETLSDFLKELTEHYQHDYGTICHATAIAAIAAANAVNHSSQGGISGFQAGCIMWGFITRWNHSDNKTGMKLVDYDNFLYPQYEDEFDKTLDVDAWERIQKEATALIDEADRKHIRYLAATEQYNKDLTNFVAKYPDYYEKKEHYDPLGLGTGDQWDAEAKKKESGFEFAPKEPYEPINEASPVYRHWQSIKNGIVPFGYNLTA